MLYQRAYTERYRRQRSLQDDFNHSLRAMYGLTKPYSQLSDQIISRGVHFLRSNPVITGQ